MNKPADKPPVKFAHTPAMPFNPDVNNYFSRGGMAGTMLPYQLSGWQNETRSWKQTCYLHTMLSGRGKGAILKGPDAEKLLSHGFVNDFRLERFPVGAARHIISCVPNGNIGCDGVCLRTAPDTFVTYTREPFISMYAASGKFDVEPFVAEETRATIFQLGGPRSLEIVENLIGEDIHDLRFMRFRAAKILGLDVQVLRMGMAGTLSYEIHVNNLDHVMELYDEVVRVGERFGLIVLGRLAYMSNHTENGFPQQGYHFIPDWSDPAIQAYMGKDGSVDGGDFRKVPLRGSMQGEGRQAYHLNPFEAGWGHSINWDHDFVGKKALEKIKQDPRTRKVVTLEWDYRDILKVFETYFDDDPAVAREMQIPQNLLENPAGNFQDKVLGENGEMIGKSTGRVYTIHYKKMISMGFIDPECAEIGREVVVIWGEPGTRQIPIRARVARYPYLDLTPNAKYDIQSIPHYGK